MAVWQKWRFSAPQTHLLSKIAIFAKSIPLVEKAIEMQQTEIKPKRICLKITSMYD